MRMKVDEYTMKHISDNNEGEYFNAKNAEDFVKFMRNSSRRLVSRNNVQVTALVVSLAAAYALAGSGLPMLWFGRIF